MTQTLKVEAAFGATLATSPGTWTWTDITRYVRASFSAGRPVVVNRGRQDWLGTTQATRCEFRLDNDGGMFTPDHPLSTWYPNVDLGLPIRVSLNGVVRAFVYADDFAPVWPSPDVPEVNLTASGILKRLGKGQSPVKSALRRAALQPTVVPAGYWAAEDPSGAGLLAEAFGRAPMTFSGPVTLGSGGPPGSTGAVTVPDNVELRGPTLSSPGSPRIETGGGWAVETTITMTQAPAVNTQLIGWDTALTSGPLISQTSWAVTVEPGTGTIRLAGGSVNISTSLSMNGSVPYGRDLLVTVSRGSAADSQIGFTVADILIGTVVSASAATTGNPGYVTSVYIPASAKPGGWRYSHISVWNGKLDTPWSSPTLPRLRPAQAWDGELAGARLTRLCAENSIPLSMPAVTTVAMGQQKGSSLLTLLRECEQADGGILYDGLTAGLSYLPSDSRYNQAAQMTLDNRRGHVKVGFAPHRDDQRIRNSWTVSRPNGGSATASDSTHVTRFGLYDDSATINIATDAQAADQAGWRVNLGTAPGMRIPAVSILPSDSTDILTAWLGMDLGERFDVLNLPPEYGPDPTYSAVLEGYIERFDSVVHTVELNSSPFGPWRVFQVAAELGDTSEFCGRLDTDGSTLAAGRAAVAAGTVESWPVPTTTGAPWTTNPDDFPVDLGVEGEQVRVTNPVVDTFSRTTVAGWGTATSGQTYTTSPAGDHSTSGTRGVQTLNSVNVLRDAGLGVSYPDVEILVGRNGVSAAPVGGTVEIHVVARYVDASNFVDVRLFRAASGSVTIAVRERKAGVDTVTAFPTVNGATASGAITLRFQVIGSTLRARAWPAGGTEPPVWDVTLTTTLLSAGDIRLRSLLATGNTNGTLTVDWDDIGVSNTQAWTVTRGVNGVSKAHNAGVSVSLWRPLVLAL